MLLLLKIFRCILLHQNKSHIKNIQHYLYLTTYPAFSKQTPYPQKTVVYKCEMKNEKQKDFCVLFSLFFAHLLFGSAFGKCLHWGNAKTINRKNGEKNFLINELEGRAGPNTCIYILRNINLNNKLATATHSLEKWKYNRGKALK